MSKTRKTVSICIIPTKERISFGTFGVKFSNYYPLVCSVPLALVPQTACCDVVQKVKATLFSLNNFIDILPITVK